jgi:hypothetical protein
MMPDEPKDLDKIKKDSKLCAALMIHMKKELNDENFFFYFDKGNPDALYKKYLAKGSPKEVNIPGGLSNDIKKLGDKGDWKNKEWSKLIKKAKVEIHKMVKRDVFGRFYKGDAYKDYLKKEKMGDPKKAAKLLGISNVKLLTQAMGAAAVGDTKKAETLLGKLAKEEKIKDNAKSLLKALEKAGLC